MASFPSVNFKPRCCFAACVTRFPKFRRNWRTFIFCPFPRHPLTKRMSCSSSSWRWKRRHNLRSKDILSGCNEWRMDWVSTLALVSYTTNWYRCFMPHHQALHTTLRYPLLETLEGKTSLLEVKTGILSVSPCILPRLFCSVLFNIVIISKWRQRNNQPPQFAT
jgi:hypothetical protein